MRTLTLTIACVLIGALLPAQQPAPKSPPTLDDLKRLDALNEAMTALDQMKQGFDAATKKRELDCLKAFGDAAFCGCIRERSPALASFADYVQVVTTPKEELGYAKLDTEMKGFVDNLIKAREVCVAARQAGR